MFVIQSVSLPHPLCPFGLCIFLYHTHTHTPTHPHTHKHASCPVSRTWIADFCKKFSSWICWDSVSCLVCAKKLPLMWSNLIQTENTLLHENLDLVFIFLFMCLLLLCTVWKKTTTIYLGVCIPWYWRHQHWMCPSFSALTFRFLSYITAPFLRCYSAFSALPLCLYIALFSLHSPTFSALPSVST